jgi:hypothetical protein
MTERDQNDLEPAADEFEPDEEEFEDEEEALEEESPADEAAEEAEEAVSGKRGRFGWRRGGREEEEEAPGRPLGTVKSHERVYIDDRISALFALIAAFCLIGVLVVSYAAGFIPEGARPSITPLSLVTPSPGSSASPTVAPTATPTATPTASPTAS